MATCKQEESVHQKPTLTDFDLQLPASRTVRKPISVVLANQFMVFCYNNSSKLIPSETVGKNLFLPFTTLVVLGLLALKL